MRSSQLATLSALRIRLNRTFLVGQFALDVLLPVAYVYAVSALPGAAPAQQLLTGVFLISAAFSLMRTPAFVMTVERIQGERELLKAVGVTRRQYLLVNAASGLYFLAIPLVAMALAAVLLRTGVPLRPAYWGTLALYALVLHGTGLLLASLFDGFGALALAVNAFLIATATVCPVLYSPDRIPHAIRSAVEILPPSLTVELGNAAAAGVALDRVRLAVLILWALAALLGGYTLFPWRDKR